MSASEERKPDAEVFSSMPRKEHNFSLGEAMDAKELEMWKGMEEE